MAVGLVDKIPDMKLAGLAVGDAVKGLAVAGMGDALGLLVQRYVPTTVVPSNVTRAAVTGAAALAVQWKPVKDFLGKDAAMVGSLFLVASAITSLYDVRGTISGGLAGLIPSGGVVAAAKTGARLSDPMSAAAQAEQIAADYYSKLGGR